MDGVNQNPEWQHEGSREKKMVECLKVSVEPDPLWNPDGKPPNYCFFDQNGQEYWVQYANTVGWMSVEYVPTALSLGTGP